MKFLRRSILCAAVATLLATSFSSANAAALSRKPQDNLIVGVTTEAIALDPRLVDDKYSGDIIANIYEGLVKFKPGTSEVVPCLAESWTVSDDGLVYTFKLRQGVKFTDGTPFNAEAAKYNIETQLGKNVTPKMAYAPLVYGAVDKVETPDEYTLKITLKEPQTPFLRSLAMSYAAPMMSPTALKANNNDLSNNPVGTGPYKLFAWDRGQQIILTHNENYWGEQPKTQNIVFRVMKEPGARIVALNNGEIDITQGVDATTAKQITDAGNKIYKQDGYTTFYAMFNTRSYAQTKDVEVRRALAQAINVPDMVKNLYRGFADYAKTYIPKGMPGYSEKTPTTTYNPDAAKKTLAAKNIKQIKIIATQGAGESNPVGGQVLSEAVQDYLKKVGVEASIELVDWGNFKHVLDTENWDISFIAWNSDNGDPDNFASIFARNDPQINQGLWQNQEYIKLIAEGVKTKEGKERDAIYEKADKVLAEDVGILPISHPNSIMGYRANIKNFQLNKNGLSVLNDVSKE